MYILGKNQPHDRSIHRRQFESIWRTSTISDLWPCGLICRVTNSFFPFFLCFQQYQYSQLQYFFLSGKRFLVSFLPETADHKLPDTIAEGEAMGQGDTLWKCFKKRSTNTKTNSVQGKLQQSINQKKQAWVLLLDKQHKSNFICTNQYNKNSGNYQPKIQFHVPYIRHYKVTLLICLKNESPTIFP